MPKSRNLTEANNTSVRGMPDELTISRETRSLSFMTPSRCKHTWTFSLKNIGKEQLSGVTIWTDTYLPQLDVRDRSGKRLIILPRDDLEEDQKEEQAQRERKGEPSFPIAIKFDQPLLPDCYEQIKLTYLFPYGPPAEKEKKAGEEKKKSLVDLKHRLLWLVGYMEYRLVFDSNAVSTYFSISAPKGYILKVLESEPKVEARIYKDERTYTARPIPNQVRFTIDVPNRVAFWLVLGFLVAALNAPVSCLLYLLNYASLPVYLAMIGGSFTVLIAMRALLFENVALLNRLNLWYMVAFFANVVALLLIAFNAGSVTFPMIPVLNATSECVQNL